MKRFKLIIPIILTLVLVLSIPFSANATTKASSGGITHKTAKQIVTKMKNETPIKKIVKNDKSVKNNIGKINMYTSKCNFYDKKYKKVYCTIEVFKNRDDAIRRAGYIDCLNVFYGTFNQKEDVPLVAYQYKNVVLRVGSSMPYKRAKQYYDALKKVAK